MVLGSTTEEREENDGTSLRVRGKRDDNNGQEEAEIADGRDGLRPSAEPNEGRASPYMQPSLKSWNNIVE